MHSLNTATNPDVCWDSSNDCCKLWNGQDWGELEDSGDEEGDEEECSTDIPYWDNAILVQESDGSLSNDSDDYDIDGLVWISDNNREAVDEIT